MPRLLARLPASWHRPLSGVLVVAAVACVVAAIVCFLVYGQATETTGHLWWKETEEIPIAARRPYLLAGILLLVGGSCSILGSLGLIVASARRTEADLGPHEDTSVPFVLARAAGRRRQRSRERREASIRMLNERRAAIQQVVAQREYESSVAGQAEIAYERGDEYFSIELRVDADLARSLNDIHAAGWRQESFGVRQRMRGSSEARGDGGHDVTRESVEHRTYVFQRLPAEHDNP